MLVIRHRLADLLLVVLGAGVGISVLLGDGEDRVTLAVLSTLFVVVFVARPISALAVTIASFGIQAIGMSVDPTSNTLQFVAMLLSFAIAGAINRGRDLVVAAVCGVALLGYATMVIPSGAGVADFALSSAIAMGFLTAGWQVSRRGRLLDEERDTASAAAAAHREQTRRALAEERARIARELHDVVSHGLSVVVVQTQAARGSLADLSRADAGGDTSIGRRLDAVETTAREALGDMRRMLGLLQLDGDDGTPDPEPPSQGLADIPVLVERARDAGCAVTVDLPEPTPVLASGVGLATYRIVQESLTNVLKHAPGAVTGVTVAVGADSVDVWVRNQLTRPHGVPGADGHGLIGMRERAAAYGGTCTAGPTGTGSFEVRARLLLERQQQGAAR